MRHGLIAPLVATAAAFLMIWAGARAETYDLHVAFHCSHEVTQTDRPAADILFVGNSQSGAAIDPVYLARLIDPAGSVKVEKVAIVESHIVALRMLVDDYVELRGPPRLVVLQPMVIRAEHWQQPAGRPIHPRANLAYQPWGELVEVQSTAKPNPDGARIPYWMHKDYRTLPAVWMDRLVERMSALLSYPRIHEIRNACRGHQKFRLTGVWPFGDLPLSDADRRPDPRATVNRAGWEQEIALLKPASLDAPSRAFEVDQHRQLLASLRAAGSEVMLVGYPSYRSSRRDAAESAAFGRALGTEVIDIRALLSPQEQERLDRLYRDPFHLAFPGAEIVTRRVAMEVSRRLP